MSLAGHGRKGMSCAGRCGRPPVSAGRLGERLGRLGLRPGRDRWAAWFQLAAGLPTAVVARLLGIHVKVTVARRYVFAGDRAGYAADVSGRLEHWPDARTA